jgi:PadR family transcriptional regulator PadR
MYLAYPATVYPLLGRLRRDGWVESTWRESSSGPPRRYYRVTQAGEAALEAFATQWVGFRDSGDSLLGQGATA